MVEPSDNWHHQLGCTCPDCMGERYTHCAMTRGAPDHENHLLPGCPACLCTVTIYWNPTDAPGRFVVRRFYIAAGHDPIPADLLGVARTVQQARKLVPEEYGWPVARDPRDDPAIYETWL